MRGLDQIEKATWHDRIVDPPPRPMLIFEPTIGDLLLDDVAQIQDVAAGQLPQSVGSLRIQ